MRIEYSKSAVKAIERMDKAMKQRIRAGIEGLTVRPPMGDVKPMEGKPEGRYRLRVGGYRVIFTYRQDGTMEILYIIDIGSRGDVYK